MSTKHALISGACAAVVASSAVAGFVAIHNAHEASSAHRAAASITVPSPRALVTAAKLPPCAPGAVRVSATEIVTVGTPCDLTPYRNTLTITWTSGELDDGSLAAAKQLAADSGCRPLTITADGGGEATNCDF